MEEREGGTEQLVALGRAERAHIADAVTVEVGCYFSVEIVPIVNDARDHKRKPDCPRYRDRIGHALVGVHASEIDKTAAGLLPRTDRVEMSLRDAVRGREQRHVDTTLDEPLRHEGHDTLPRPVVAWRHAPRDRREHRDAHGVASRGGWYRPLGLPRRGLLRPG